MSAWAPIHGSLNYYNNHLQIQPTTFVRDDQSLVLDRQTELRINTELNSTIKRFEEVIFIFLKKGSIKRGAILSIKYKYTL